MNQTTKFATCLGLLAGSLAIATAAQADIPITGGQATGDAAFFTGVNATTTTINRSGAPVLFDTAIQTLRIVTPNGTTTTSRFLPNAAQFTDVNSNSRADAGDTGRLEGSLSGVAFNRSGFPVFFQNVPTALNFKLTSFTPVFTDPGSLISPKQEGTAPLIFLPGVDVQLSSDSSTNFESKLGLMEVGPFAADLTGDFIGLPSDLQFRASTTTIPIVTVALGERVKFDFEGKDAQVDDAAYGENPLTNEETLAFSGDVTKFQIQTVGTRGRREVKINGSGTLDIALTGPFDIKKDDLDLNSLTGKVDYRIKGEGPGLLGVTGANSIAYSGTSRRATDFKFEQGGDRFEGKSDGRVSFTVNDDRDSIDFGSFKPPSSGVTTITTTPIVITPGSTVTSTNTSSFSFSTTVFNSTSIVIFPGYQNLLLENYNDDGDDGDDDGDDDDNQGYGRNVVYYVYAPKKESAEVVIERDGDVILVVDRSAVRGRKLKKKGQVVAAYKVVGLPSRVFPGLTGLRQIPADQVQSDTTSTGTTTPDSTTPSTTTPDSTTPSTTTP